MSEQDAIQKHLGFIISVARKFRYSSYEELDEYIHLGKIGLLKAYRKFDKNRGTQLTTYAWYYIRKEIIQHIKFKNKGMCSLSPQFDQPVWPKDNFSHYLPDDLSESFVNKANEQFKKRKKIKIIK